MALLQRLRSVRSTTTATRPIRCSHVNFLFSRRMFARSSEPSCAETPADKARTYIISLGHESRVAQGVVDALTQNGLSGGALLSTVRALAGRVEVGEDAGLEDLIQSVQQELARTEGKTKVKFWCVPPNAWSDNADGTTTMNREISKTAFSVEAFEGMTLTDVAKFGDGEGASVLGEHIECACSGIMACSTCHVVVDDKWFSKVGAPQEAEQDMIDLSYEPTATSRLGCQIVLTPELDGLVVKIPRGVNNMMDFIPFGE